MSAAKSKCEKGITNAWHCLLNSWHWIWRGANDRTAARIYLDLLSAEYQALDPINVSQANNTQLYEKVGEELKDLKVWADSQRMKTPEWTHLCSLESRLLRLLPRDALKAKRPLVEERLRELIGAQDYAVYENVLPQDEKPGDDALREGLIQLVNELHFRCRVRAHREKLRSMLTVIATIITGGIIVGLVVLVLRNPRPHGLLIPVLILGFMGGFVSIYLRMQNVDLRTQAFGSLMQLWSERTPMFVSPIFGAAFAGLLFLLFAGQWLSGGFFPCLQHTLLDSSEKNVLVNFILNTKPCLPSPTDNTDNLVKLLVWSFLAGFAERLVPNALNRITAEVEKPKGG